MTSSTAGPGVLDEINALFSWNPPRLIHFQGSTSTATRSPSFYDKHFSRKHVLERVVRLPSLVKDLADNVDKALDAALATLPPLNGLITAEIRADDKDLISHRASDEKAVATYYQMTTGKYCAQVASTLALHPNASFSRWRSLLWWTQSCAPPTSYAIMDGLLCFIEKGDDDKTNETRAAIMRSIENEDRVIVEEMQKSVSALATWAMKSTSAGPVEVMNAVLDLGKFNWTSCNPTGECQSSETKAKIDVAKVKVGLDAKASLWNIPDDSNTSLDSENRDEETDIQPIASSSATLQRPVTQRVTRSAASGSSILPPPQTSASRSSEHGSPTKVKSRKRKRDDEAYQNQYDKSAESLVQHAWAQAVKVDGTLIVLHSGNHEIVCVRRRDSQTLYVSDVIEPPTCVDPGYGKLHVGIYIAAVQDAMDRWREKPPGGDLIGGNNDQDNQYHSRGSGGGRNRGSGGGHRGGRRRGGHNVGKKNSSGYQRSAGRKIDDELVAIEKMIHVTSNRNVVLLYLQYDIYDSPIPASFLRSAPSIMAHPRCPTRRLSPRFIRSYGPEECLTIVLTSEIGRGVTGVVHRGTLEPEVCDGAMPLDVVVKLAFDTGQRYALRSEYEVYRHLRSNGVLRGIPTVLGLFDDSEDAACALVMLYAGVPLGKESQHILSVSDCHSALSTLESIHRAGILHGDIRRNNILIGDLGVTIIDFGHSEQCDDQEAKDKELAQLRCLLGLTRESD